MPDAAIRFCPFVFPKTGGTCISVAHYDFGQSSNANHKKQKVYITKCII
jgi:hypothetical protein